MASLSSHSTRTGVWYGVAAYLTWGFFPLYFKAVGRAGPLEILAHRIAWSTVVLLGLAVVTGAFTRPATRPSSRPRLGILTLTTLLLSSNWLLYIWAVAHGRVVEASLGYFITPLVNVLFGLVLLRERISGLQRAAVVCALLGVACLVVVYGHLPLIAMGLACSFGLYGLLRKQTDFDPLLGLLGETALLCPLAVGYLIWLGARGTGQWGAGDWRLTLLLTAAGVITSGPLLCFAQAARRLPLSTLGLLQYLSPTCQLLLGVLVYGERFQRAHAVAFGLIWLSLALYSTDARRRSRAAPGMPLPQQSEESAARVAEG